MRCKYTACSIVAYSGSVEDHAKGLQQRHHFRGDQVEPDTAHADAQCCKACIHPAKQTAAFSRSSSVCSARSCHAGSMTGMLLNSFPPATSAKMACVRMPYSPACNFHLPTVHSSQQRHAVDTTGTNPSLCPGRACTHGNRLR